MNSKKRIQPNKETLKILRMTKTCKLPVKGTRSQAGLTLFSDEEVKIPKKSKKLISTGIKMKIPIHHYGRIAPLTNLSENHFLDIGAGVVDSDYRGEVKVLLFNFSNEDFLIKKGDCVAQIIFEKIFKGGVEEVEKLADSERGQGGFGSTGKR